MRHEDLIFPESVSVVYPTLRAGYPTATPAVYSITLTSLALPTLSGVVGRDGFTRVLHSSATASYADIASTTPSNNTELQALANQIATDFYLHLAGRAEVCLSGIQPWLPSGLEDVTEWDHSGEHIVTRSRPCAWLDGPDDLWHHGEYASASPPTSGGATYVGGDVTFIDSDVTHQGGTLTLNDTVTTFSEGSVQFDVNVLTILLEDGNLLLLEDGDTSISADAAVYLLDSTLWLAGDNLGILLESGDALLLENGLYLFDADFATFTIDGGGKFLLATWLEVCSWWGWCYHSVTLDDDIDNWLVPATDTKIVYRVDPGGASRVITGIIPGINLRHIVLLNVSTDPDDTLTLSDTDSGSTAVNQFLLPRGEDIVLYGNEAAQLWWNDTDERWQLVALAKMPAVDVRINSAGSAYNRSRINFIGGTNITVGLADDAADNEIDVTISMSASIPGWTKVTKTYADLATAGTSNAIEVYSLPAKGAVHAAYLKTTTAFGGGGILTYTLGLGVTAASYTDWIAGYNAMTAPSDTNFAADVMTPEPTVKNFGSATSIKLAADSMGANLNAATAGVVEIYLFLSQLP